MKSRRATWLGLAMSLTTTWAVGSPVDGWTDFRHGVPDGRDTHTAVWTGSRTIVWGGYAGAVLNTGSAYDPSTDTWTVTSMAGAPSPRYSHVAVWTGSKMIVWGGYSGGANLNTGGVYDPATDTWTATSMTNAPSARRYHRAVWTGSTMIVWGGIDAGGNRVNTGGVYDPATDMWTATTTTGAPAGRSGHTAVWTGSRMIVWGGYDSDYTNTGGVYDPATDTWTATTMTAAPWSRSSHTAIWTGSTMIVWGGNQYGSFHSSGGIYDPAANTWTATTTTGAPPGRNIHTAIWTGSKMIVWGGYDSSYPGYYLNTGGVYDPASNTWTATSTTGAPSKRQNHAAVWTGSRMIVWGGFPDGFGGFYANTGGLYDPVADTWSATSAAGVPSARGYHTAISAGSKMIVWGGYGGTYLNTGGVYDSAADTWAAMSTTGAPSGRQYHTAVWTGSKMIVWGGYDGSYLNTGGVYDPVADTWTAVSTTGAPSGRRYHTAVWTGSRMIVWGGYAGGDLANGGIYDPDTDTWTTPSTAGASGRSEHTAVWTGSKMIVWGGIAGGLSNTGGAYDPTADTWTATSTAGAPSARYGQTAVWTGSRMVVWGGYAGGYLGTGGVYDPATNTWTATSTTAAPSARQYHTAVWTGSKMIVWGGYSGAYMGTGGVYSLATDTWTATSSAGAPSARYHHKAVWPGSRMVVWGGYGGAYVKTGGLYDPGVSHALTVSRGGSGSGAVTSSPAGITCGADCAEDYDPGTSVTLTPNPAADSTFISWSGACTGAGACVVTMDAAKSVTAIFTLNQYALTVATAGNGSGTVTSSPAGISCGADCSETYDHGTSVTLTPSAGTGSTFTSWSGACTGLGACVVTMDAAKSVTATFTLNQYALTVSTAGTGSGTVSSSPAGISCGADCSETYDHGTSVTLTPTAVTGSTFTSWSGACTGSGACVVTMDAAKSVTAIFTLNQYALTVATAGTGSGTVSSSPAGISCGVDCSESYDHGTSITLTPSASTGSTFTSWSGACSGSGACVVTMDAAKSVTATFTLNQYALTVSTAGNGSGSVSSSPAGISCGADCSESYDHGTSVTLTPSAATGSTFTSWSGACTGSGACVVTMDAVKSVTAAFTLDTFALTVSTDGTGTGSVSSSPAGIDCGSECSELYDYGTLVTLVPSADAGSTFTSWAGDCTGSGACVVTMDAAKSVTATFTVSEHALAVGADGSGSGTVTSSPAGIDCGSDCSESYAPGTEVTLTPTAAIGSAFVGWSGDCSGTGACVVTMDAAKSVTATFDLNGGTGFYTLNPCRVVDTRAADGPALAANTTRTFAVAGVCEVPATAKAVAVNVTVANETHSGNLRLYPAGSAVPPTSTINFVALVTRANNAVIGLGIAGEVSVKCAMPAGSTHFVLDVTGYFE